MRKNITYFYDPSLNLLVSKVGSEIAVPIIDLMKTLPKEDGGYYNFKE